ncbi:hypothetical protein BGZ76_009694 [Entomortierella beljakovae]|nr:hypothetical protein BGZ76_009694 [Entomortierella beljakovae]
MVGLRTRKIVSAGLVIFTGALLFHLSSNIHGGFRVSFVDEDTLTSQKSAYPSPNTRDPASSLPAPEDIGSVLRHFDHLPNEPIKSNPIVLPKDIPKPTTHFEANVKYLSYMPYAGLTNQYMALESAAYLAIQLNRTLIIPPIITNSHDIYNSNQRWSDFFDFPKFKRLTGADMVEWDDLRPLTPEQKEVGRRQASRGSKSYTLWNSLAENLTCQVIYGFGDTERLHTTELTFSRQFLFQPQFERPPPRKEHTKIFDRLRIGAKDNTNLDDVVTMDDLKDRYLDSDKQILHLSHTFKLKDPLGRRSWQVAGRHFYFLPKVTDYAKKLINYRAPETKVTGKYIAIHLRRGDIWQKCRSMSEEKKMDCIPPLGFYAEAVEKAYRIAGEKLPVIVATDSKSEEDHATIAKLGWRRLNHDLYITEQELGIFGPALVDAAILADAEIMIGSYSSSMSRVAERRQRSWHGRDAIYPRTSTTWMPSS